MGTAPARPDSAPSSFRLPPSAFAEGAPVWETPHSPFPTGESWEITARHSARWLFHRFRHNDLTRQAKRALDESEFLLLVLDLDLYTGWTRERELAVENRETGCRVRACLEAGRTAQELAALWQMPVAQVLAWERQADRPLPPAPPEIADYLRPGREHWGCAADYAG